MQNCSASIRLVPQTVGDDEVSQVHWGNHLEWPFLMLQLDAFRADRACLHKHPHVQVALGMTMAALVIQSETSVDQSVVSVYLGLL